MDTYRDTCIWVIIGAPSVGGAQIFRKEARTAKSAAEEARQAGDPMTLRFKGNYLDDRET